MNNKEPFENFKYFSLYKEIGAETDPDNGAKVQYIYWNDKAVEQANNLDIRKEFNRLCQILDNCNNEARTVRIKRAVKNLLNKKEPPAIFKLPPELESLMTFYNIDCLQIMVEIMGLCNDYKINLDYEFAKQFEQFWQPLLLGINSYDEVMAIYGGKWQPQQQQINNILPPELLTDEAKAIFNRGVEMGLFQETTTGYKRDCTKQLIAYFAQQMSLKFELSNKLGKEGQKTVNWKVFEFLFNEKDLKGSKNDWMKTNTKFTPNGFEKIDQIINPT